MEIKSITQKEMPQYQPDYVISWDFSRPDFPCVVVNLIERDEKDPTNIHAKTLGVSCQTSGVISLRQVIEYQKEEEQREKKRAEKTAELRKTFKTREDQDHEPTT